jgi:type II secretory pathway component PulF
VDCRNLAPEPPIAAEVNLRVQLGRFAGALATANPAGLIISTGMKVYGETSGSSTIEGGAEDLAKEIAKVLQVKQATGLDLIESGLGHRSMPLS